MGLIDPPWEEYVRRAPGVGQGESWSWQEIKNLEIDKITDNPAFVFLWYGSELVPEQWLCMVCITVCTRITVHHVVSNMVNSNVELSGEGQATIACCTRHCCLYLGAGAQVNVQISIAAC